MEDFSTIIWAVIILGAMIYNSTAKARKARAKGEQTSPQHGEAWPSIPWDDEEETSDESAPAPRPARQEIRPASRPAESPVVRPVQAPDRPIQWVQHPESGRIERHVRPQEPAGMPEREHATAEQAIPKRTNINSEPGKPVFRDFPGECQSLEEVPAEEYRPEIGQTEATVFSGSERSSLRTIAPRKGAETVEPGKPGKEPDSGKKTTNVAEEFDLRRAVIYSEILKPKFEE